MIHTIPLCSLPGNALTGAAESNMRPGWLEFLNEILPDKSEQNLSYLIFVAFFVFYLTRSFSGEETKSVKRGLVAILVIMLVSAGIKILYELW